jgi:hypothetical protein
MSESHWQLFLDDHVLARTTGFDRVIHKPTCRGVVIPADKPWETNGLQPLYVERRPDGKFICFYNAMWWDIDRAVANAPENFAKDRPHQIYSALALATSDDGIHWDKPTLRLVEAPAGVEWKKHAPFPSPEGTTLDNNLGVPFVVCQNLHEHGNVTDPARHYALRVSPEYTGAFHVAAQEMPDTPGGYFAAELPDFINDRHWRQKLTATGSDFNPRRHTLHFWDDLHNEWVAMDQGVWPNWLPSREIGRFASKDLKEWTSEAALYPDSQDPHDLEHYEEPMVLVPWHAEGMVFGLLGWFHSDRSHPHGGPVLEPTKDAPFRWPWARKGTCELRITISRDGGKTWDRTSSREAWVPHGTEHNSPDRILAWGVPPVFVGDEDYFYVYACNQDHLNTLNAPGQQTYHHSGPSVRHVMLYTQKHNRYVSMRSRNYAATLITQSVRVIGNELELNVDADRGSLQVGIASADPVPTYDGTVASEAPHLRDQHLLKGFGFEDCVTVETNALAHKVTFNGASIASLKGRDVVLLFKMINSELYGFRFNN